MSKKKKRLLWLVLAVLILTGAALFSLLPRRAAAVLHLPNSTAGIQDITLAKTTPGGETGEVFVQDYTLTPNREAELVQEVCDWLKAARFRDPRFSTAEFGSGLLAAAPSISSACSRRTVTRSPPSRSWTMAAWLSAACSSTGWTRRIWTVCGQFSTT